MLGSVIPVLVQHIGASYYGFTFCMCCFVQGIDLHIQPVIYNLINGFESPPRRRPRRSCRGSGVIGAIGDGTTKALLAWQGVRRTRPAAVRPACAHVRKEGSGVLVCGMGNALEMEEPRSK